MKEIAAKNGKSLDKEALQLEEKIKELKKEIFSNLTRWQKVRANIESLTRTLCSLNDVIFIGKVPDVENVLFKAQL